MRWLWVIAGMLLAMSAQAREARDYEADETSMVNCIEAAETALLQTGVAYEPVVPALKQAHEAWELGKDCEFARIQAGMGTDRYDAPARCGRDQVAERALLYRRWLKAQTY